MLQYESCPASLCSLQQCCPYGHSCIVLLPDQIEAFAYCIMILPYYIAGGTWTCIHTPGAAFTPEELSPTTIDQILSDAQLVYFDGRLTEAAVVLAKAARHKQISVLVEAERLRPTLDELLQEADYVCTSAHFPQVTCPSVCTVVHFLTCLQSELYCFCKRQP